MNAKRERMVNCIDRTTMRVKFINHTLV